MQRVLIVDDEEVVRDVLCRMVKALGTEEVDTASDGLEGLEKIRNSSYDIVFTDLRMPKLSGFELMREARTISPTVPFVVVTAVSHLDAAINALRDGASDFITKPFKFDDIKKVVERVTREYRLLKSLNGGNGRGDEAVKILTSEVFRKLQEINSLFSLATEIDELKDNRRILKSLPSIIAKLMKANTVVLLTIENDFVVPQVSFGNNTAKEVLLKGSVFEKITRADRQCLIEIGENDPFGNGRLMADMLIVPLSLHGEVFGFIVITDKVDGYRFNENSINLVLTFLHKVSLTLENNALYDLTYSNLMNTLKSLILTIEARDLYTRQHSENVTRISLQIADVIGCTQEEKDALRFGGYLHDIGKIGVKDIILLKPGRLSPEEYEEIKKHPVIGDNIVQPLGSLSLERLLIRHHHERYDGRGYPDGLDAEKIPRIARILAIADTYDSMTTTRPYRKGLSHYVAVDEIKRCSGTQFDPEIVRAFFITPTGKRGLIDED